MSHNFSKSLHNLFHDLSLGSKPPTKVNAVIEISKHGKNKYEYDKTNADFRLDRVLYGAVYYPTEYGFLPQTWSIKEQDPLDIMVLTTNPTFTGCIIESRPIGIFKMIDRGVLDHKIIALATHDPRYKHIKKITDLGSHFKKEIQDFWENYAKLQPTKKIEILGWGSTKDAHALIKQSHQTYLKVYK